MSCGLLNLVLHSCPETGGMQASTGSEWGLARWSAVSNGQYIFEIAKPYVRYFHQVIRRIVGIADFANAKEVTF